MGKSRRRHILEFKIEAVKRVVEHDRPVAKVADGLRLNSNMLTLWKSDLAAEGTIAFRGKGNTSATI